jgi:hydroxymethylbilane synthase
VPIQTSGDRRQDLPFTAVGVKGMFVKEIEDALLSGQIDCAIHSMKDMPGRLPEGLIIAAVPPREDPRDALLSDGRRLADLPAGSHIGTSSMRRANQLLHLRPDLRVDELRGNLDTRLRKLDDRRYDAIILACAGLARLGCAERIVERLNLEDFVPAPGQGAIAVEARQGDEETLDRLSKISDPDTVDCTRAERGFQDELGLGCSVPVGAHAQLAGDQIQMTAMQVDMSRGQFHRCSMSGSRGDAEALGRDLAKRLLREAGV